ncbi:hypothetical protein [Thioalkalivibrio sp. ALMg11]|uniref:hypothetical protein n=1 Tax=Thioalkalivibrio sp. ALMg11 TaxID=1158165 RepID=UPI00036CC307|nr:hypothetical protein [Thioalkalivibrio sp. ALMg11]
MSIKRPALNPRDRSILAESLFGMGRYDRRTSDSWLDNVPVFKKEGMEILYSGPALDLSDRAVWEQVLRVCSSAPPDAFEGEAFLRAINRTATPSDFEWLDEAFERLIRAGVIVRSESARQAFGLVKEVSRSGDAGPPRYSVVPHPSAANLFLGESDARS